MAIERNDGSDDVVIADRATGRSRSMDLKHTVGGEITPGLNMNNE